MKKIILSALMLTLSLGSFAQKGKNSIQANVGYGSKIENVGFGIQFNWAISKKMEFAPSINQFLEKDGATYKDINFDFHYLIPIGEKVKVYPLLGFSLVEWGYSSETATTSLQLNYGVGARYPLTEKFDLGIQVSKNKQVNSLLTIGYKL